MNSNERFKALLNIQKQLNLLMEVTADPAINEITPGADATINRVVNGMLGLSSGTVKIVTSDLNEFSDGAVKIISRSHGKEREKAKELARTLGDDINSSNFKNKCMHAGVVALGLGAISAYILYPSIKSECVEAFNHGNPDLKRFGHIVKGIVKSIVPVALIGFGCFLMWHANNPERTEGEGALVNILRCLNSILKGFDDGSSQQNYIGWQW